MDGSDPQTINVTDTKKTRLKQQPLSTQESIRLDVFLGENNIKVKQ